MNYKVINILLLIAVAISVALFHFKFNHQSTDIDDMEHALQGLKPLLHPSRPLVVEMTQPDEQWYQYNKYLLAPVRTLKAQGKPKDTMLFICPLQAAETDSLIHRSPYHLVWQGADKRFSYLYMIRKH